MTAITERARFAAQYSRYSEPVVTALHWLLSESKPGLEFTALFNLVHQGFAPYIALGPVGATSRAGRAAMLFPGFVLVGFEPSRDATPIGNTSGVKTVVTTAGGPHLLSPSTVNRFIRATWDEPGTLTPMGRPRSLERKLQFLNLLGLDHA